MPEAAPLPALDQAVRLAVLYGFLDQGHAPAIEALVAEVGQAHGADKEDVRDALRRLHEGHALVLRPGHRDAVLVAHPFSSLPTPFVVTQEGPSAAGLEAQAGRWWGYCMWDSLAIAAILQAKTAIATRSGAIGEALTFEVDAHRAEWEARCTLPEDAEPVVHVAVPARFWWEDIAFTCGTILAFAHRDEVAPWCAQRGLPKGAILDLPTAWALAKVWYGDRLSPTWRRRSPKEAHAVFERLGLTGAFWRLEG